MKPIDPVDPVDLKPPQPQVAPRAGRAPTSIGPGAAPETLVEPTKGNFAMSRPPTVKNFLPSLTVAGSRSRISRRSAALITGVGLVSLVIVFNGWYLTRSSRSSQAQLGADRGQQFGSSTIGLSGLPNELPSGPTQKLDINGQTRLNRGLVVTPSATPADPSSGQIYYNQGDNRLYYYNGSSFITLSSPADVVSSLGGLKGDIALGNNLSVAGGRLNVSGITSGVSSIQGQTGAVSLTSGAGIGIAGTRLTNTGLLSLKGLTGTVDLQGTPNQVNVTSTNGLINLSTPQAIDANANVQFGNLTLGASGTVNSNKLQQTAAGNNVAINAGNDNIVFTANGKTFQFPAGGGPTQTICTTGVSCAAGVGSAVIVAPTTVQTDGSPDATIFINDTAGGNLLQLQSGGVDKLVVSNNGDLSAAGNAIIGGSLTVSSLANGIVRSNGGVLGSGAVALGVDTTGSYIQNLGALTGLTVAGNSGPGSTPTLGVTYGSGANSSVQGNTTLTCPSGTGNLSGGG